ncbi:MAG: SNF2-related protein [Sphaerochaetaceae bacterium]
MTLKLREYQEAGVDFLVEKHRAILADEPGLGKTVTALTALKRLGIEEGPILVIGPKISLGVWRDEAMKWFGDESLLYSGDIPVHKRSTVLEKLERDKIPLLITNYAMIGDILQYRTAWQAVICDEIHLGGLLNHKSATFGKVRRLRYRYMFLITGTPVRRNPADLFAPLHLLDPFKFKSYWSFVWKHCIVIEGPFGKSIEARPKNPLGLNAMLQQYLIRRTKKKVLKELPPKTRQALKIRMTKGQAKLYTQLAEIMMVDIDRDSVVAAPNEAVQVLRLRQMLVTPQLLESREKGAALEELKELVDMEFASGRSVAVCTPFRQAVPYVREVLEELTGYIYEIHGKMKRQAADVAMAFQGCPTHRKCIIYTIKSGASFTVHAASTAFFVGYEWSAIDNLQAEERLHRIGQLNPVNIYYLMYEDAVTDQQVMDKLDDKQMASNWILRPHEIIQKLRGCTT